MAKKIVWLVVSCLMALSLVIASCAPAAVEEEEEEVVVEEEEEVVVEEEEEVVEEEVVEEVEAVPTGVVPWWKKDPEAVPEYGGTIIYASNADTGSFEHYFGAATLIYPAYGCAAFENWMTTDPEDWGFETRFTPPEYFSGDLAESWDLSEDLKTMTMHVRKGVHWQNKPPVNGREFTAYDMEFSYQRTFGLGSGFDKPSPYVSVFLYGKLESITATDKYTLEIKWAEPSLSPAVMFLDVNTRIIAPEVIKQYGDANKWDRVVGTGPFMLEDYVPDSTITFLRNPNYWAHDEHWPENRLPYVDEYRILVIPDDSTRYAAMRTGQVDLVRNVDWEDAARLVESNPELVQHQFPGSSFTIVMPPDRKPWSDIRVRKAMQMALDLDTIAKTYYGGTVPGTPVGPISSAHTGFYAPYEDWPQEVKDGHAYNPEGAKQLLAEAGYPEGFKTRLTMATVRQDTDLAQILVNYFSEIGVTVELDLMEYGAWRSYVRSGKTELATPIWADSTTIPPQYHFPHFLPDYYENPLRRVDDPVINDLVAQARAATNWEDMAKLIQETDMHVISQFYNVRVLPTVIYTLHQPWVKRLAKCTAQPLDQAIARCWIDEALKKEMQ